MSNGAECSLRKVHLVVAESPWPKNNSLVACRANAGVRPVDQHEFRLQPHAVTCTDCSCHGVREGLCRIMT